MALTKVDISMLEDAGASGQVLTSDGTNWTSAVAAGGGDSRNFVIDGDFTQWPEGTSARTIANNTYISALLKGTMSHDGTITGERSTDVPTVAQSSHSSQYSVLLKCTGTDASIGASQRASFDYFVTGTDYQHLHTQQVTISFWAKTAAANSGDTYYVSLHNSAFDRSYVQNITVTSTWTKFTITATLDTTGTWLFTEADKGLVIRFGLSGGTDHDDGTVGSWVAGNERWAAATPISNFMDSTSNEFYISQLSLVKGSSAPDAFLNEPISAVQNQVEYYVESWRYDAFNNAMSLGTGVFVSLTQCRPLIHFHARKRKIPTMTSAAVGSSPSWHFGVQFDTSGADITTINGWVYVSHMSAGWMVTMIPNTGTYGAVGTVHAYRAGAWVLADARH